jgi:lipoprotein-anchoring transpeptidase ErfK/SrfK
MKTARFGLALIVIAAAFLALNEWAPRAQVRQAPAPPAASAPPAAATTTPFIGPAGGVPYVDVVDSCGPYFDGTCVNMRSGPGTEYPVILKLRQGIVFQVAGEVQREGRIWYKLEPGGDLRYPERVTTDWYVAADVVRLFYNSGVHEVPLGMVASTSKRILVDLSQEMLYAYDGDTLFLQTPISTGLELTPTPRGVFEVYRMTPSRYMQGPIPEVSDQSYDLPGVPWNLFFTADGSVIHGAYWHDHFGQQWSHGCINLPLDTAEKLYNWAQLGMTVTVR